MNKTFISATQMEQDAWRFGIQLHQTGIHFDWIIGITRGGAQISIYIQEVLALLSKKKKSYGTIHAYSYTGISTANSDVNVLDVTPLIEKLNREETILIVDDIFDRGITIDTINKALAPHLKSKHIKSYIATLYYKKECSLVNLTPDFYYKTCKKEEWLVFPHELDNLTEKELQIKGFPVHEIKNIRKN